MMSWGGGPPSTFNAQWDIAGTGTWKVMGRIRDEDAALSRINQALRDPTYDLFLHNCEHFARFVATGLRESRQLQAAVVVVGLAVLTIVALRSE